MGCREKGVFIELKIQAASRAGRLSSSDEQMHNGKKYRQFHDLWLPYNLAVYRGEHN